MLAVIACYETNYPEAYSAESKLLRQQLFLCHLEDTAMRVNEDETQSVVPF